MHTDPKTAVAGHRGRLTLLAVGGLIAAAVMLNGCSDGEDADALPADTGAATITTAPTPSQSPEEVAEAAALAYYATLRELYREGSDDRGRLSDVAGGSALTKAAKDLGYYRSKDMHDNGKRSVKILDVTPQGPNVYVRTCSDKRKVRFKVADGGWGPTLAVNINEEGLTLVPADGGWKVAKVKNIFTGGCHD